MLMKLGMFFAALSGVMFFTAAAQAAPGASGAVVVREFIYEQAPFVQCHASTIAQTPGGLVAAWFGGTREKHPDVCIYVSRRINGKWTEPLKVADGVQYTDAEGKTVRHPCWNPVLFQQPGGKLLLFYKVGPSPREWWGMITTSDDGGMTWSWPHRLPEGVFGPIKNKPVRLESGTLLCPTSGEATGWRVQFEMTDDGGITWRRTDPIAGPKPDAIQPTILIHSDGSLQALCRTRHNIITQTWSRDGGKTWSDLTSTNLPQNNSGLDAVTLRDGRFVLVYNHTTKGRSPLNLAVSEDGEHWQAGLVLEDEPGEYSYPAVIQSSDGLLHITYTWKRQRVRHIVVNPAKLTLRPIIDGKWPD